jgi:hypothetical protein
VGEHLAGGAASAGGGFGGEVVQLGPGAGQRGEVEEDGHLAAPHPVQRQQLAEQRDGRPDAVAARRVAAGRTVVGLDTRELLLGGGNIHCAIQQIPAGDEAAAPLAILPLGRRSRAPRPAG